MKNPRRNIQLLPEHLIDQIKAGEVIERPSALIKELLENSIDANASEINIHLVNNGVDLISIIDNGYGMTYSDLPYAFCRHATSKISKYEDIYNLYSYGFRGEALASISSISRLSCTSSPKENPSQAGKIVIHGGEQKSLLEHSSDEHGTAIYIKDLFYNTPARLKFLKSKVSEKNALKRIIQAFLLSNPKVKFTIKWDDKDKIIYHSLKENGPITRAEKVLIKKKESEKKLIEVKAEYEGSKVHFFISKDSSKGNAGKKQFLFVNGRLFNDRQVHQAIVRGLEKVWGHGETGDYVLFLTVPPSHVDMNVHPSKIHVKFFKPAIVFSLISSSLKNHAPQAPPTHSFYKEIKEQDQDDFNLSKFENSPFQEHFNKEELTEQSSNSFINLGGPYKLFLKDVPTLINTKLLFNYHFKLHLLSNKLIEDQDITPLLISEPFKTTNSQIDIYFSELKEKGFEFERIESDTILLRTIPCYLDCFNILKVISPFVEFLSNDNKIPLKDYFCLKNDHNIDFDDFEIEKLLKTYSHSALKKEKIIKTLDLDSLNKIMGTSL